MYKITKKFQGYPFAHRQHTHGGHCKLIHGHNWDFVICLQSSELDEHGFIYDFGKFKPFKEWLEHMFDHTILISKDDPQLSTMKILNEQGLMDMHIVESCSCEGIAKLVYEELVRRLKNDESDFVAHNVSVVYVQVYEDHKNTAVYSG